MTHKFDSIRFYDAEEVSPAVNFITRHPMMKLLLQYSFPGKSKVEIQSIVSSIKSIEDFQSKIIYPCIQNVLATTSDGLTVSGIENLEPGKAHLFISNHRDIVLDTSILNLVLLENNQKLTASVIGDNLVQRELYLILAKLNRNFFVKRNASPRELLENSKLLSEYIFDLIINQNRPVWIAQREGRAKDGNDITQPGVLKMIAMNDRENNPTEYFKKLNVVPVSISYEYDPTDKLKAEKACVNHPPKEKHKNEDFLNIMTGVSGQKKRIHLHFGKIEEQQYQDLEVLNLNANKQIQQLSEILTKEIIAGYKLWPSNYIAADLLQNGIQYAGNYTENDKQFFVKRMNLSIDKEDPEMVNAFLEMYANPVFNKEKIQ